jgi:mitotic-spindle organizing protein 1
MLHLALYDISRLMNTGLDMETLTTCVKLCEAGVNPEALAAVIKEIRRETAALKVLNQCGLHLDPS